MDDRRRAGVPWYLWRWRIGLIAPMVLFGVMAGAAVREIGAYPVSSVLLGVGFVGMALMFARLMWRARIRGD